MQAQPSLKFYNGVILFPFFFTLFVWMIFWFELRFGFDLKMLGVFPRKLSGLWGVAFSPFVHGSLTHLYHNSFPLLILLSALFYFYAEIRWKIILYGILLSGLFTWIFGRPAYHIGASGFIYVLVSFIFFKGIFTKYYRLIALSFVVVFIYGGMLWYIFPVDTEISWEGHLSGFIAGLLLALGFKHKVPQNNTYSWEKDDFDEKDDPFMQYFDADGNFISKSEKMSEREKTEEDIASEK